MGEITSPMTTLSRAMTNVVMFAGLWALLLAGSVAVTGTAGAAAAAFALAIAGIVAGPVLVALLLLIEAFPRLRDRRHAAPLTIALLIFPATFFAVGGAPALAAVPFAYAAAIRLP
jgi:hypothetical protein